MSNWDNIKISAGVFGGRSKMIPVKLIIADGLEYTIPNSAYNRNIKTILRNVTDGSRVLGTRTYKADPYRDGEFREVATENEVKSSKTRGSTKQKTPETIKEILKAYPLQELIRMKLEDVEFKGVNNGK
jgi:hypothetical protein